MRFERQMAEIDAILKEKDSKRESVISLSREIIRKSGSAVLSMHRGDPKGEEEGLEGARVALDAALGICRDRQEFYYVGPMPQAFQEYAEARIVASLLRDQEIPSPEEMRVPVESYITGLADAVGEMRRYALDSLRRDEFEESERALQIMDEAYTALKSLDFPRAVVPNLKRKVDVIRRLVEETRGDVTLAHQGRLIRGSLKMVLEKG